MRLHAGIATSILMLCACGGAGASSGSGAGIVAQPSPTPTQAVLSQCSGSTASVAAQGSAPIVPAGLTAKAGLTIQSIADVGGAREIAALPNGDLIVGTSGTNVYIVPNAEAAGAAGTPSIFASVNDAPDAGVAFSAATCMVYVSTQYGIYATPYRDGDLKAEHLALIASVRTGSISPNTDGDVHRTTSIAAGSNALYAGIGSSCNACVETDPTRATVQQMALSGGAMTKLATRIRNAIALAIDPGTGHLWVGGAGQDNLPSLHPYEYMDDLSAHGGLADYGWPACEENHIAYIAGSNCSGTVEPLVELPAYSTLIGAAFYPLQPTGTYALSGAYRGALIVTRHGSWHTPGGCNVVPEVDMVAMNGDSPATPVDWSDPTRQWMPLVSGFQPGCAASSRIGRPTGIAIGSSGSIFVGDDQAGVIFRIRP